MVVERIEELLDVLIKVDDYEDHLDAFLEFCELNDVSWISGRKPTTHKPSIIPYMIISAREDWCGERAVKGKSYLYAHHGSFADENHVLLSTIEFTRFKREADSSLLESLYCKEGV